MKQQLFDASMCGRPAPLALTMGDPAGCATLITHMAWSALSTAPNLCFYCIADADHLSKFGPIKVISEPREAAGVFAEALPVLPISKALPPIKLGLPSPNAAAGIIESIELATYDALKGIASGIVTNPISKAVLYEAGFKHPGHTEFIADLTTVKDEPRLKPVMMLVGGGLRVALATIHVPLMKVLDHLTQDTLIQTVQIVAKAMREDFSIPAPRIALTGLNPHAGEQGTIGTEEVTLINPVAEQLRHFGIDVSDARSADTVFHEALNGQFDAVIAMTHDQGLIPIKTLDMWGGVNTTLGLPIVRTSPDHGTAYEAAQTGKVRPDSLIAAIKLASKMGSMRQQVRHA